MPELPEVETMCRGVAALVGYRITAVTAGGGRRRKRILIEPPVGVFRGRCQGAEITQVARLGKRVVVYLDRNDAIVFEPRMTGIVLVAEPPDREHLRFRITLQGRGDAVGHLFFWDRRGLGCVRLLTREQLQEALSHRLGPDALGIATRLLRRRLESSRRAIKVALLDQHALAGIGNLYASEILHVARIHPGTRCDRLSGAQWPALRRAMQQVLRQAIRFEGSTLADGTYRNALNGDGRFQELHRVYARQGQPCRTCGHAQIVRMVQAQRSTFFCPSCQRV